jgi:O-antigen ligase
LLNSALSPVGRCWALLVGSSGLAWTLVISFDWASGWFPSLIAFGVVLFIRFPRTVLGGALLLITPALIKAADIWNGIMTNESYSWMTRVEAWNVVLDMVQHNPWLGFGPANYFSYARSFPILGYNIRFNSHNNYVDLLAQTGVIGLLAFAWVAFEAFRLSVVLYRHSSDGFARAYAAGAVAGLVGTLASGMLADWIVPFAYNVGLPGFRSSLLFWFFLGGLLALRRLSTTEPAPGPGSLVPQVQALTNGRVLAAPRSRTGRIGP